MSEKEKLNVPQQQEYVIWSAWKA